MTFQPYRSNYFSEAKASEEGSLLLNNSEENNEDNGSVDIFRGKPQH